jgi:23S rRNA (uridine2552-2'-O)-methyltransferase
VQFIQGDFRENEVAALLEAALQGRQADVVVSDMAPNLSGIESSDAARVQHLIELAVEFAQNHMKPQGALVVKVFHGSGYSQIVKMFKETFKVVKSIKPKSSRDKSSETFLVGMGLIQAL